MAEVLGLFQFVFEALLMREELDVVCLSDRGLVASINRLPNIV